MSKLGVSPAFRKSIEGTCLLGMGAAFGVASDNSASTGYGHGTDGIGGGYDTMSFDQAVDYTEANYYLHGIYDEAQWNIYKQRRKAAFVKVYDWGEKYGKQYVWGENKINDVSTNPSESDVTNVTVDNNDDTPYNPEPQYQPWLNPIRGDAYVTSDYGEREHPFRPGAIQWHPGIDLIPNGVPRPQRIGWDIIAPQGGTTSRMSWDNIHGWNIYLRFMYEGRRYELRLSHLRGFLMRQRGLHLPRIVRRGDVIGAMGSSGDSTGPHLDMEIRRYNYDESRWEEVDPDEFYNYGGVGSVF